MVSEVLKMLTVGSGVVGVVRGDGNKECGRTDEGNEVLKRFYSFSHQH